jgi:hypothetical protein
MPAGRPSSLTPEIAEAVCAKLREGLSLREVCRADGMPDRTTVMDWVGANETFAIQYATARAQGYAVLSEELLEIADDGKNDWLERQDPENPGYSFNGEHYQRSRLRVDTRKWLLSKMLPKVYGDTIKHSNDPENPMPGTFDASELAREVAYLLSAGLEEKPK